MKLKAAFFVICFACLVCPVRAQSALSAKSGDNPVVILAKDTARVVISPAHYDKRDWLLLGAVSLAGFGLYSADGEIRDFVQRNAAPADTAKIFKRMGDGQYLLPSVALAYGAGAVFGSERLKTASVLAAESFVIAGLIANTVKLAGHRHRPNAGDGPYSYDGISFDSGNTSFPSGHTTVAFAVAGAYAGVYDDKPAVAITAYGLASLVGLSRMNDDAHWASDVFFGAVLGYFTSKAVVRYHNERAGIKTALFPYWNGGPGVMVSSRF